MSDNELDAELLALAGDDDSSDDEGVKAESGASRSRSRSRSPDEPADKPSENVPTASSPPKKPTPQHRTEKTMKATPKKARKDDSEEEGEASSSPTTPKSLGSGAMSESQSDTSPGEAGGHDDVFPLEGKYYSEKDKADIMALSEIQREAILAERAQEVERKTQDLHLRRLLQARERAETKTDKKKRKAGAAELEDNQRKSSRQKVKASEPLEALKRQRAQRAEQRRRQDDRKKRERRSSSTVNGPSDDADAEGESEVEWDNAAAKATPPVPEVLPADLRDFERVRVGRTNFAKVCFYPGFEAAINGCFCRVSIGVDRSTGQNTYRMAQIKGFTEGKPYSMEAANGKILVSDQYAIVAHGKAEKEWPFLACSDSRFTEAEFERYKKAMLADGLKISTKAQLSVKLDGIHALLNRSWTDEDIAAKLKRQNKYADQPRPTMGMPPAKVSKGPTQQERLAALNKANRKLNAEEVRKAQIAEKRLEAANRAAAAARHAKAEREAAEKAAAAKELLNVPAGSHTDELFGSASDLSRAGTPAGTNTPRKIATPRSQTPLSGPREKRTGGLSSLKKRNMDDDLIGAIDLGIEIDI